MVKSVCYFMPVPVISHSSNKPNPAALSNGKTATMVNGNGMAADVSLSGKACESCHSKYKYIVLSSYCFLACTAHQGSKFMHAKAIESKLLCSSLVIFDGGKIVCSLVM